MHLTYIYIISSNWQSISYSASTPLEPGMYYIFFFYNRLNIQPNSVRFRFLTDKFLPFLSGIRNHTIFLEYDHYDFLLTTSNYWLCCMVLLENNWILLNFPMDSK
jgi:hypothetical protein